MANPTTDPITLSDLNTYLIDLGISAKAERMISPGWEFLLSEDERYNSDSTHCWSIRLYRRRNYPINNDLTNAAGRAPSATSAFPVAVRGGERSPALAEIAVGAIADGRIGTRYPHWKAMQADFGASATIETWRSSRNGMVQLQRLVGPRHWSELFERATGFLRRPVEQLETDLPDPQAGITHDERVAFMHTKPVFEEWFTFGQPVANHERTLETDGRGTLYVLHNNRRQAIAFIAGRGRIALLARLESLPPILRARVRPALADLHLWMANHSLAIKEVDLLPDPDPNDDDYYFPGQARSLRLKTITHIGTFRLATRLRPDGN